MIQFEPMMVIITLQNVWHIYIVDNERDSYNNKNLAIYVD